MSWLGPWVWSISLEILILKYFKLETSTLLEILKIIYLIYSYECMTYAHSIFQEILSIWNISKIKLYSFWNTWKRFVLLFFEMCWWLKCFLNLFCGSMGVVTHDEYISLNCLKINLIYIRINVKLSIIDFIIIFHLTNKLELRTKYVKKLSYFRWFFLFILIIHYNEQFHTIFKKKIKKYSYEV